MSVKKIMSDIVRIGTTARWSDIVIHNKVLYVVEIPNTLPADALAQSVEVLQQLEESLLRGGSSKERLLMCTIYLKNIEDRSIFNSIWDTWLPSGTAPVRACVQIANLADNDLLVEIQATAAVE